MKNEKHDAYTRNAHCPWRPCQHRSPKADARSRFDHRKRPTSAPCILPEFRTNGLSDPTAAVERTVQTRNKKTTSKIKTITPIACSFNHTAMQITQRKRMHRKYMRCKQRSHSLALKLPSLINNERITSIHEWKQTHEQMRL